MAGYLDLHVDIIKGGMAKYGMKNPIFKPGPVEPHYSDYLIFEGISVDEARASSTTSTCTSPTGGPA